MSSAIFRVLLGLMVVGAAGAAAYFHYFRPPIGCTDDRVVDTARRIVKERLVEGGAASDVTLHLITTTASARDGVRCMASAQIQMGIGKDDQYRDVEYMAFVGKDYFSSSGDKKGFIVFANFKK